MSHLFKVADPDFFVGLKKVLQFIQMEDLSRSVPIENFICKKWNCYYDLHNPEDFEDPDNCPDWHDNSDSYEYYEKPYWNPSTLKVWSDEAIEDFAALKDLIENAADYEGKILEFFVNYTFNDGGAYAAGVHFEYARRTIEADLKKSMNQKEFLMNCLCVDTVKLLPRPDELILFFRCAWDTEHGVEIKISDGDICCL